MTQEQQDEQQYYDSLMSELWEKELMAQKQQELCTGMELNQQKEEKLCQKAS